MSVPVSVVIPAYNAAQYIGEAIESVLAQGHQPLELIVLDDGSTDRTPDVVGNFRNPAIRYARQDNRGAAAAFNAGLALVTADLVTFLSADDVWTPGRLRLQLDLLDQHPEADIVLGHLRRMWLPAGQDTWKFTEPELALSLQSCLVRRQVFDKVGRFDESLRYCFDWDWFFRARELGVPFFTHAEVTNHYRRHAGSLSEEEAANREVAVVIKRSLDRRRAMGRPGSLAGVRGNLPDG
jgi:glycosyltransferase involved in cell wall biosynthesis